MITLNPTEFIDAYGLSYFKDASSFGALSDDAICYLIKHSTVLKMDKDDPLFKVGDPVDSFFIILQGYIRFFKQDSGCKTTTHIRDYTFGQEVGCVAMIGLHDRVGNTYAGEQDTIVLEVPCATFHGLQQTMPNDFGLFLLNLSREMARRLRESDQKLAENNINDECFGQ